VREALLSYWLLAGLLVHAGSHVALLVGLFRSPPTYMAFVALVLPPLAPYYGWRRGWRRRALMWLGGLLAYAVGVVFANAR
jgi:drug/metabolite transporter (DMT)-like permease